MLDSIEAFRRALWLVLLTGLGALAAAFATLVLSRLIRKAAAARRATLERRYRSAVDRVLVPAERDAAIAELVKAPRVHRGVIGAMLLRPLRVARGDLIEAIRIAAAALGRDEGWRADVRDHRWWVRADAVRALGLIRDPGALKLLLTALEDDHDEVRAAAVEAIGLSGDPAAIPALLARLSGESRHQRVRVVEALRMFGPGATPALVAHARAFPDDRLSAATVLGQIGGADALPSLVELMSDDRDDVRAAAIAAAGTLGLDDRAFYFVLKALGDQSAAVRAMAARAIARSARAGTAAHLDPLLDDGWDVAVQAALSLKRLGREGRDVLERRAATDGQAADLASQMLWEGAAMGGGRTGA